MCFLASLFRSRRDPFSPVDFSYLILLGARNGSSVGDDPCDRSVHIRKSFGHCRTELCFAHRRFGSRCSAGQGICGMLAPINVAFAILSTNGLDHLP
jgi:hypothetical protein